MKNVHKCTFKLHAGENRYLERLWLLATQFGSQTSRINYHLGACRKYRLLGPALCSLNQNQPLSKIPPSDSDWARGILSETLWTLLLDAGRSITIASLFPRNLHMLACKSFYFPPGLQEISLSHKVMKVKVAQLCPTFCDPHRLVHGILQARILEWVAPFPSPGIFPTQGSNPGLEPRSPALQVDSLPVEPQGKPKNTGVGSLFLLQWIFLTQELNWGLLHCRWILYQLSYGGKQQPLPISGSLERVLPFIIIRTYLISTKKIWQILIFIP